MKLCCLALALLFPSLTVLAGENWLQTQGDSLHSGNAPHVQLPEKLGLLAAIPLTDGVYASPVVADETIYAVDGSGVVFAIDARSFEIRWKFATRGGAGNCNNVAAPAIVGETLHVGTMAGF